MEIKIDVNKVVRNVTTAAAAALEESSRGATREIVSTLMDNGKYYGHKKGLAYEIAQKKVEDYVLSDAFSEMLDRLVLEEAEAQGREAVKSLLNSKARKRLFGDEFKSE